MSDRINWEQVRERLLKASQATREALSPPPERAKAVMNARAVELARRADSAQVERILDVVTFEVSTQRLALETAFVQQVVRVPDWTPLPGAGDVFFGATNFRGEVLPLCRLEPLLGVAPDKQVPTTDETRLIVVGKSRAEVGFLIDGEHAFLLMPERDITEALGFDHLGALFKGIDKEGRVLLNGDGLLGDTRLTVEDA